jgi:hypothetical protein
MSIIFTCFAGRERYMKILIPYIRRLKVDEVHIWDYTRNDQDAQYLKKTCSEFRIFSVSDKSTYKEYYNYYTRDRFPDPMTVLIKCDDDIVFIETAQFNAFIKARRESQALIMSPIVINHPICQPIQLQRGILPGFVRTDFGHDANPNKIHKYFLKNPKRFIAECKKTTRLSELPLVSQYRFNINFIAILGRDFDILQNEAIVHDDEAFLGINKHIIIDHHFVVAHMAYTAQRNLGYDETNHLQKYSKLLVKPNSIPLDNHVL